MDYKWPICFSTIWSKWSIHYNLVAGKGRFQCPVHPDFSQILRIRHLLCHLPRRLNFLKLRCIVGRRIGKQIIHGRGQFHFRINFTVGDVFDNKRQMLANLGLHSGGHQVDEFAHISIEPFGVVLAKGDEQFQKQFGQRFIWSYPSLYPRWEAGHGCHPFPAIESAFVATLGNFQSPFGAILRQW